MVAFCFFLKWFPLIGGGEVWAVEFSYFEDDHIFVHGLESAVGPAGAAIEESAAEDVHVEELEKGAEGHAEGEVFEF